MEGTKKPPRAYVPSQPAVKSSQPQVKMEQQIVSTDTMRMQNYSK